LLVRVYFPQSQQPFTSSRCWFQKEPALYVTVHGYFLITFLFEAVVLIIVTWKVFTLSSVTAGKERRQNWKSVLTVLGLSSLVGVTWGLAILTPLGLSTVYIFTLFNSLQGEALGPGRSQALSALRSNGRWRRGQFAGNRIPVR
jgi:G protein-coupled receptor 97